MIFKTFQNLPLVYGLSSLAEGNMHLGFEDNGKNRNKFFQKQNIIGKKIIAAELVHGTKISIIDLGNSPEIISDTDALVTSEKGTVLTITVADCFPIYFYNPKENKIGLAHSSWRGTLGNIGAGVVKAIDGNPGDILVGIGPGIQSCHFEIKQDILDKFMLYPNAINRRGDNIFIDLPRIIEQQLADIGVKNIENSGECTYCLKEIYFSFRRDRPQQVEAMLGYIGLN